MEEKKYKYFMHFLAKHNKSIADIKRSSRTKSVAKNDTDSDDNNSISATMSAKHGI
jgi:hypothetical protein